MDLVSLLASDSYIIYNKEFASKYGVESGERNHGGVGQKQAAPLMGDI